MLSKTLQVLLLLGIASGCGGRQTPDSHTATDGVSGEGEHIVLETEEPYKKGAWGKTVDDPKAIALVREVLHALVAGKKVSGKVSGALIVGPALWRRLLLDDVAAGKDELSNLGTIMTNAFMDGRPPMPARMYNGTDLERFLGYQGLRELIGKIVEGTMRPATEEERRIFYILIPFEIKGEALTVVELGEQRLVASLDDGKLMWIDLLSGYDSNAMLPPAVVVRHVHLHQSDGVLRQRIGDAARLTQYAQGLRGAIIGALALETPSATAGLYIGIAARPDGSRRFWIDSIGEKLSGESLKGLQEALQTINPPPLREGPLLFSMGVGLWGHSPKFPDLVEAWRAIMKSGDHMPDEALSAIWR